MRFRIHHFWIFSFAVLLAAAGLYAWWLQTKAEEDIDASFFAERVAISDDGKLVAIGTKQFWTSAWNVAEERLIGRRKEDTVPRSLVFSQDNHDLLYSGHGMMPQGTFVRDALIKIYDANGLQQRRRIRILGGIVGDCIWGADDTVIAILRQSVGKFSAKTGNRLQAYELNGVIGNHVRATARGGWLVYGTPSAKSNDVLLHDAITKKLVLELKAALPQVIDTHLSADGLWLAVAGRGDQQPGQMRIWDVATGHLAAEAGDPQQIINVQFTADNRLFTAGEFGRLTMWNFSSETGLAIANTIDTHEATFAASCADDGKTIVSSSEDALSIWDVASGQQTHTLVSRNAVQLRRRIMLVLRSLLLFAAVVFGLIGNWQRMRMTRPRR